MYLCVKLNKSITWNILELFSKKKTNSYTSGCPMCRKKYHTFVDFPWCAIAFLSFFLLNRVMTYNYNSQLNSSLFQTTPQCLQQETAYHHQYINFWLSIAELDKENARTLQIFFCRFLHIPYVKYLRSQILNKNIYFFKVKIPTNWFAILSSLHTDRFFIHWFNAQIYSTSLIQRTMTFCSDIFKKWKRSTLFAPLT